MSGNGPSATLAACIVTSYLMHRNHRSRKGKSFRFPVSGFRFPVSGFQSPVSSCQVQNRPRYEIGIPGPKKNALNLAVQDASAALPQNCQTTKWILGPPLIGVNVTLVTREKLALKSESQRSSTGITAFSRTAVANDNRGGKPVSAFARSGPRPSWSRLRGCRWSVCRVGHHRIQG
jgi:hypothetical protein